ncbi:hypothetical protein PT2222_420024 [Paraburkholderia tropica]
MLDGVGERDGARHSMVRGAPQENPRCDLAARVVDEAYLPDSIDRVPRRFLGDRAMFACGQLLDAGIELRNCCDDDCPTFWFVSEHRGRSRSVGQIPFQ